MLIFVLEDEPPLLRAEEKTIARAAPEAEVRGFPLAAAALEAVEAQGLRPDIAFVEIEMPGISGLEFAGRLKTLSPDTRIVFVTGYTQYAYEAFRVRAQGYILKPLEPEQVKEELALLPRPDKTGAAGKLQVKCFGHFEVYWQGEPLIFARKQAKELFAFLIDREGAACTAEDLIAALWEGEQDMKAAKTRIRRILSDLRNTLRSIGMEGVLIRERRQVAIRREAVDCDYYRMLAGDAEALDAFHGEYMIDYSWAELTAGKLYFRLGPEREA